MFGRLTCRLDRLQLAVRGVPVIHIPATIGAATFKSFTGFEMCPECQADETRECDVCATHFWDAFGRAARDLPEGGQILLCSVCH